MKCNICHRKTNWDESYGHEEFIVCPRCHNSLLKRFNDDWVTVMSTIFLLGEISKENSPKEDEG